jgi:hypothetical protein
VQREAFRDETGEATSAIGSCVAYHDGFSGADPMTLDEVLEKFGLPPSPRDEYKIRQLLLEEIARARRGEVGVDVETLRALGAQLFSLGRVEDALVIWDAKQSSFDASCCVDVQLLCGAGLEATKKYLAHSHASCAPRVLDYLTKCEQSGDFVNWTPQSGLAEYQRYYRIK